MYIFFPVYEEIQTFVRFAHVSMGPRAREVFWMFRDTRNWATVFPQKSQEGPQVGLATFILERRAE